MTLQSILNVLNSYNITTHISWDVVKYDADKAIYKINDYLGTVYPKMSEVLISPEHSYSVTIGNRQIPIFPERYILSIVIPFIASEILAREEEFTTVYNKFIMEVEEGLFAMFQNEFNRVPIMFRQSADDGVFFENQKPAAPATIDTYGFHVHYHANLNDDATLYTKEFNIDTHKYTHSSIIVVQKVTQSILINPAVGYYCYVFKGWTRDPRIITETGLLQEGDIIEHPLSDVHLYAVWDKQLTINISHAGEVSIKPEYKNLITRLRIPSSVNGRVITQIPAEFITPECTVNTVILPKSLSGISSHAFQSFKGSVIFPPYDKVAGTPNIVINNEAFDVYCVLDPVYIPISVTEIYPGAFLCDAEFYCEHTTQTDDYAEGWHTENSKVTWGVDNG